MANKLIGILIVMILLVSFVVIAPNGDEELMKELKEIEKLSEEEFKKKYGHPKEEEYEGSLGAVEGEPGKRIPVKEPAAKRDPVTFAKTTAQISNFLTYYQQYRGLSRLSSLFFTGEAWETYREKVNQFFCDQILIGGSQCWTSRICDTQLYAVLPRAVFSGRTPSGEREATAIIQGEKSLPIATIDRNNNPINIRLYKTTYAITNPYEAKDLKYNVQFRTADGFKINKFDEFKTAPDQRTEASPLVDYGKKDYAEVCLVFTPSIVDYRNYHGRRIREWCSPIVEYIGTATKPYPTASNDAETTPAAPASLPQIGGQNGLETNRFQSEF